MKVRATPMHLVVASCVSWLTMTLQLGAVIAQPPGSTHTATQQRGDLRVFFPHETSVVEIPFRDENGMVVVDVRVNGSRPLAFIIETGWSQANLLMAEDIADVEFDFTETPAPSGTGGVSHRLGRPARNVRLDLGDLRLEGVDMEVTTKGDAGVLRMLPEDGILGTQFLQSLVVEIDWQQSVVRLHDPSTFQAPPDVTSVPLETRVGLVFASGEVTVDGKSKRIRFVVDTGSAGTLLLRADRVRVPRRRISGVTLGQSLYGPVTGAIGRIDRLEIGGAALKNMVVRFLDGSSNMVAVGADANLGTGVLRRFVVTFDYGNERMLMKPTDAISDPFPFTTSGMAVERQIDDGGAVAVVSVYEGSPASRAGLAKGDRIISVDSTPVRDLGVERVREKLHGTPGTKVTLEVLRSGSVQTVELELTALL